MVATPSTMLALGTEAPPFALEDTNGRLVSLDALPQTPGLLVMFICNHCPFVKHIRHELAHFAREYQERGIQIVAINSNDIVAHPEDHPDRMRQEVREMGYSFPYLFDETQEVAKAYRAACTPDFFLFDGQRRLAYRGQFDDSRPSNSSPVNGADLRAAAEALLAGQPVPAQQKPSLGCNIKWKPGKAPEYFSG